MMLVLPSDVIPLRVNNACVHQLSFCPLHINNIQIVVAWNVHQPCFGYTRTHPGTPVLYEQGPNEA